MRSIYKHIREVYKHYAGISPCSNVPSISQNAFLELINLTTIVDSKDLKLSDIDLEFTATKAGNKKNSLNPDKWWLVRYQLMEIFVRIALKKYFRSQKKEKNKKMLSESDAVKKLFEEQLLQHFKKHDCHRWREKYCWCQEVDEPFQEHLEEIKSLFQMYSGKYCKPGKTRFMSLDEFNLMIS